MPDSTGSEHAGNDRQRPSPLAGVLRALLRVPLVFKVLVANAAILTVAVIAALLVVRAYPELRRVPPGELLVISAALTLVVGAAVNAAIIRLAFIPLRELEDTAEQIAAGEMQTRASISRVADRRLRQLITVFNGMLDHLGRERERRRRLAIGTLRAEDRARRQLAAALHNDTAQRLAAHILQLKQIEREEESAEKDRRLGELREEMADTLETVRQTARGLHPPELEELGLVSALRASARNHPGTSDCQVEIIDDGLPEGLSEERRVGLYRIFQEALSNALRHAEADRVSVRIGEEGGQVRGQVVDDGRGFDVRSAGVAGNGGLGLGAMKELAEDLGGSVAVESAIDRGTRVRVSVPPGPNTDSSTRMNS